MFGEYFDNYDSYEDDFDSLSFMKNVIRFWRYFLRCELRILERV